jgi:hypothetical protein
VYRGDDPLVARAHAVITRLRRAADIVTLFEQDMTPYWLAVLEWTYSVIGYVQSRRGTSATRSAAPLSSFVRSGKTVCRVRLRSHARSRICDNRDMKRSPFRT